MADVNDDLLDGELDGEFGELDGEEEDALLADDDFEIKPKLSNQNRAVYIDEDAAEESDTNRKVYYGNDTNEEIEDVAEGDEILEEEEGDVLDLGVDEIELDESAAPRGQQDWPRQGLSTSDGNQQFKQTKIGGEKVDQMNVSSSTTMNVNSMGAESDDDDDEERRSRFKTERTSSNIISLKTALNKSLANIPDSLDNVVSAEQLRGAMKGMRKNTNKGRGAGGNMNNHPNQGHVRGVARGFPRGRANFQRPPRLPIMPPFPVNQGMRPAPPPAPMQGFPHGPKIHINPHFRGPQPRGIRPEWENNQQHPLPPPGPRPMYNPAPPPIQRVFHNPQAQQPPPQDRLVCGDRITIQTNSLHNPNFQEFPNRPFNNGHNNMFLNQPNVPRPSQNFEEPYPPYQDPGQQFTQEFQVNEWNQGPPQHVFNSPHPHQPLHQQPIPQLPPQQPPQFFGRDPALHQQMYQAPGPPLQQFQPQPPGVVSSAQRPPYQGVKGRLGPKINRTMNKRMSLTKQVNNDIPFKQARFDQRKGGQVSSNLHEVQTVDNLPDTTTEPEEEDDETKQYRLKIEEQKKLRAKIMAEKEARRQQAAAQKIANIKNDWEEIDDGPPGVDPEPHQQTVPLIINQTMKNTSNTSVRGGLSQRGRGAHQRICVPGNQATVTQSAAAGRGVPVKRGGIQQQPTVTVTSTGICLPTTYKTVRVRTKDGSIQKRRTPVLLVGSPNEGTQPSITRSIQNIPVRNYQVGLQAGKPIARRGAVIPVRAHGPLRQVTPDLSIKVSTDVLKKPLTIGERFQLQKTQQVQSPQPLSQTKSNRIVMPNGLVKVTPAINTVPIPNSRLLTIDNLSASTTKAAIMNMAKQVGKLEQLKLDTPGKKAILRFVEPNSAALFFQKFQRKMVDLSMINITVVPE